MSEQNPELEVPPVNPIGQSQPLIPAPTPSAGGDDNVIEKISLIDNPIDGIAQDSLSLAPYAAALATFIYECNTPVTIGIQGDWGIGKTSLLNMLKEFLRPGKGKRVQTPTIYLNTWQYAQFKQEEFLAISILSGMIQQMETTFPDKAKNAKEEFAAVKSLVSRLGKFAGAVANSAIENASGVNVQASLQAASGAPAPKTTSDDQDMASTLQLYREKFANLVSKMKPTAADKLVVMIDDLDRVRPLRAIELLEAIKNFADVPGCVFVLAVDYAVIQQGVSERLGAKAQLTHGKSYFDKIIQVPFNMPVNAYKLDNYITTLLGWKFDGDKTFQIEDAYLPKPNKDALEHKAIFEGLTRTSVGSNPRGIKRVINYVKLLKLVRDEGAKLATSGKGRGSSDRRWDINSAKLLYALACMQIEWPEVFSYFAKNPTPLTLKRLESWDFISGLADFSGMWWRYQDQFQAKTNLIGFFDEIIGIVDEDGNGDISIEEFRPIWQLLRDAQLTNVDLPDETEVWEPLRELVGELSENSTPAKFIASLKLSSWCNPMQLRLKKAGNRFVNIIWEDDSLGCIVTSKSFPLQMYVQAKMPHEFIVQNRSLIPYLDVNERDHRGTGNLEIDVERIIELNQEQQTVVLNTLLTALLQDRQITKAKNPADFGGH